jgi:hypothetical protein
MRLEATAKPDEYNVWLTDDDLDRLRRAASHRDDLILQLGSYVGLFAFEIPQICPQHVKRTANGDHYRLRVPRGKDTTGSGGKPRDAYLPPEPDASDRPYRGTRSTRFRRRSLRATCRQGGRTHWYRNVICSQQPREHPSCRVKNRRTVLL